MEERRVNALSFAGQPRQPVPVMAPPALFLMLQTPVDGRVADRAAMVDLLRRSGLAGTEVAAADTGDSAISFTFGGQAISLLTGDAAAAALVQCRAASDTAIGMAVPARVEGAPFLALRLSGDSAEGTSARATALFRLAHIAATLVALFRAEALYWPPAGLWSPAGELASTVLAMERQGMPPVLPFVAFVARPAEEQRLALSTRGLGWVAGVELTVSGPAALGMGGLVARAARLALDAMLGGDMAAARTVPGLVRGETIMLAPDPDPDRPGVVTVTITGA